MICKKCGTESKEPFCPRCGEPMYEEPAASAPIPTVAEACARPSRKPPLRIGMIFWQAIALLLPLAYLFFDAICVLADQLFLSSVSGSMNLSRLMERLSAALYAGNSVSEIAEATLGESTALWQTASFSSLLAGDALSAAYWLPLAVTALMAFLCAVCSVFLLLTGGRILRLRFFTNLALLCGTGAVFAPLLGNFALRISYCFSHGLEDADTMMQRVLPSFEYLCIMGVLACALLPALSSLKSVSAYARRQNGFLAAPFGALEKRSFRFKRMLLLLSVLSVLVTAVCCFCLPITTLGHLNVSTVITDLPACWHAMTSAQNAIAAGDGAAVNFLAVAELLIRTALPLASAVLLLSCVPLAFTILRILTLRGKESVQKKSVKRTLERTERRARGAMLAPYASFVTVQLLSVLFLLFFTPVVSHLNFSNTEQTLSVLYLTVAHVRVLGGTETLYALIAACGMLLWKTAGSSADAMLMTERISRVSRN